MTYELMRLPALSLCPGDLVVWDGDTAEHRIVRISDEGEGMWVIWTNDSAPMACCNGSTFQIVASEQTLPIIAERIVASIERFPPGVQEAVCRQLLENILNRAPATVPPPYTVDFQALNQSSFAPWGVFGGRK